VCLPADTEKSIFPEIIHLKMSRLPKVACFHGGGSNREIFEVQCARLQDLVKTELDFVFFDAPFKRSAGPGVLPAFENYGPFLTWFLADVDGNLINDGSGYDAAATDGIERVRKLMAEAASPADWVGVMGFSQGTRVAGGMLLDQQRRAAAGLPNEFKLKFGVLCMGGSGPMESHVLKSMTKKIKERGLETELTRRETDITNSASVTDNGVIRIPTLHVHGLKDSNLESGRRQLSEFYDQSSARLFEIDYHHAMPWNREDLHQFARLVKAIFQDTK
jgi:hypothetical protein